MEPISPIVASGGDSDSRPLLRRRGLDRETNKALLLQHIKNSAEMGTRLEELQQVLPGLSRDQVRTLLRELKRDGLVYVCGITKAARWFTGGQKPNSKQ